MPSPQRDAPRTAVTPVTDGWTRLGRSMPADLAEQLRAQIYSGMLAPGDRLPNERDLAAFLGVGRITVREAIKTLVNDGHLISRRGKNGGTFVSDLEEPHRRWVEQVHRDPAWLIDLMEYRKAVEMRAVELAAERRTAEQLKVIREVLTETEAPDSLLALNRADHRFHVAVAQASGSGRLLEATIRARGEGFVPIDRASFRHRYAGRHHRNHIRIVAAVEAGDPDAARAAVEQHLQTSLDYLLMAVEDVVDRTGSTAAPALAPGPAPSDPGATGRTRSG